jgi:NAD+ synthase
VNKKIEVKMRKINYEKAIEKIVDFIITQHNKANLPKAIVGLSGGIDSSLTATLCVKALGKENVIGIMMPYKTSHPDSLNHAKEIADFLQIKYEIIEISPMVDEYFKLYAPNADKLRKGNFMARSRMCVLYDKSAQYKALVAGTGNKSELLIGYCTQYGDSACAYETIGDLYKTEVWETAKYLGLPNSVIEKKPTADLWHGQSDEEEMGITYKQLDEILYSLFELKISEEKLTEAGFSLSDIKKVISMYNKSEFKRNTPPIAKI